MNWIPSGLLNRLGSLQWQLRLPAFILAAAVFNAVIYHRPLYSFAVANLDYTSPTGALTLATVFILVVLVTTLVLSLLSLIAPRWLKPLCVVIVIGNAVALYFVETYGVVLDKTMMGNVFNTNVGEASELFHPKLLLYLLVFGAIPGWVLWRTQIQTVPLLRRAAFLLIALALGVTWGYANAKTWLWIDKNSKRLGGMTMPWSYLINGPRYLASISKPRQQVLLPAATFLSSDKTIVFLVIGEAARAQNFSLYGYARETNPLLARDEVIALRQARACSTYTTASVACILSADNPGGQFGKTYESLPSYLQRHGIDVIWRTHNWGEPALNVQTYERASDLRRDCHDESCAFDEVLLHGLEQRIRSSTKDKVFVVLHQHGSHGPAYYAQYPRRFEVFTPVCQSVELSQCTNEALVNAYDNTIVYTDYFLHQAIELLKRFSETPSALLYISDHGESLGEYGLYLHGTPYSIAPDVQKDIPFLVWMSAGFERSKSLSATAVNQRTSHSDEDVFHSVMGAFDMRSAIYREQLDVFSPGKGR